MTTMKICGIKLLFQLAHLRFLSHSSSPLLAFWVFSQRSETFSLTIFHSLTTQYSKRRRENDEGWRMKQEENSQYHLTNANEKRFFVCDFRAPLLKGALPLSVSLNYILALFHAFASSSGENRAIWTSDRPRQHFQYFTFYIFFCLTSQPFDFNFESFFCVRLRPQVANLVVLSAFVLR